ncbi:MAG: lysine biosynthesis protein LysW [Candidatus Promineifilaceae bacterium]
MNTVACPECDAEIEVAADIIVGEILECDDCSTELEVVKLDPVTVEIAPEVEEDWGE